MLFTTSDGAVLYYKRKGAGEPIVFIHGLGSNLNSWHYQFKFFSSSFDTLSYDCRGHGRSTVTNKLSMKDHIQDVYEICRLFSKPVNIIGISMGGYIAQGLLSQYPEVVKRMVLISTKSHGNSSSTWKATSDFISNEDPRKLRFNYLKTLFMVLMFQMKESIK